MAESGKKVPKLAKDNPERMKRNVTIGCLRSTGKSLLEIAQEINVSKATVSRALQDSEVKEILEETTKYYATFAPMVREGFIELLASEVPEIRQKAISEYHKVMGMAGSQVSIAIQNLYATQNNVVLPEHLQRLLAQGPGEVIDVTPYKDTSKAREGKE